jgi:hypothetical protein
MEEQTRMSSGNEARTFAELARERTEELRRRQAERYEAMLRERFKERYPGASPEQQRKIGARIKLLVARQEAALGSRNAIEPLPLQRFEQQLQQRLVARYPDLAPLHARKLQERVAKAVQKEKQRMLETRKRRVDEGRSVSPHPPGAPQREFYER